MSSTSIKKSLPCGVDAAVRETTMLRQETDTQTNVRKSFEQGLIPGLLQGNTIQLNDEFN